MSDIGPIEGLETFITFSAITLALLLISIILIIIGYRNRKKVYRLIGFSLFTMTLIPIIFLLVDAHFEQYALIGIILFISSIYFSEKHFSKEKGG